MCIRDRLLAILEKYLTDQKKKEGEEKEAATTPTSQPAYFPMKLLSAVYERDVYKRQFLR